MLLNLLEFLSDISNEINKLESTETENKYIIKSYSSIEFLNTFYNLHSLFRDGQQDAIEFIRIFLSDISNETNISSTSYKEFLYEDL